MQDGNQILSITRADGQTFSIGDRIHSPGARGSHLIHAFKISKRHSTSVEEIWVVYNKNSGGHWLNEIIHGDIPKIKYTTVKFPLDIVTSIPKNDHPGAFGVTRKHDIHTGIDLYCNDKDTVYALSRGTVVSIQDFTGSKAESPWWNDTQCIIVREFETGNYVLYGELIPTIQVGDIVELGTIIGNVEQVLKKDKGVTPTSMLHLEYYDKTFDLNPVVWQLGQEKPKYLLDPIVLLDDKDDIKNKELVIKFEDIEASKHFLDLMDSVLGINVYSNKECFDNYGDRTIYQNIDGKLIIKTHK